MVILAIQTGCHLPANRGDDFAALTTPVSYCVPTEAEKKEPDGFAGKTIAATKKTAAFVGKGALLVVGFAAWMWLDDDDETIIERQHRKRNEQRWKNAWRDNPDVNPAMTAAFKDDHK